MKENMISSREREIDLKQIFRGEKFVSAVDEAQLTAEESKVKIWADKIIAWHQVVKKFQADALPLSELEDFKQELADQVKFDLILETMSRQPEWQKQVAEIKIWVDKIRQEEALLVQEQEQITQARQIIAEAQMKEQVQLEGKSEAGGEDVKEKTEAQTDNPWWSKLTQAFASKKSN